MTNNNTGLLSELSDTVAFGQGVVRSFSVFTHEQGRRLPGSECADGTGVRNDLIVCRHGRGQFVPKDLPDSAGKCTTSEHFSSIVEPVTKAWRAIQIAGPHGRLNGFVSDTIFTTTNNLSLQDTSDNRSVDLPLVRIQFPCGVIPSGRGEE